MGTEDEVIIYWNPDDQACVVEAPEPRGRLMFA